MKNHETIKNANKTQKSFNRNS